MKERRSHLILLALLVGALIGIALLAIPGSPIQKKPTLGLDLQGGLEVVLEAQPTSSKPLNEAEIASSVDIIRNRIDKLGVSEPEVRKQGENQIVVQLAGVFDINRAVEIIGKTAQLQLYDLQASLVPGVSTRLSKGSRARRRRSTRSSTTERSRDWRRGASRPRGTSSTRTTSASPGRSRRVRRSSTAER